MTWKQRNNAKRNKTWDEREGESARAEWEPSSAAKRIFFSRVLFFFPEGGFVSKMPAISLFRCPLAFASVEGFRLIICAR